jgi:sulfopyruvate decarboxylase TPP-binding subunit
MNSHMDYPGEQVAAVLTQLGFSHVVWLPDSAIGPWEQALEESGTLQLVRVCREGEAWAIAAGLYLGGKRPLVMIQNTGLFESGDALRNVLFDMGLPLVAVIGYRSALVPNSTDTACRFTEPILQAWGLDYVVIRSPAELPRMADHLSNCQAAGKPGVVLVAEGRM